LLRLTRAVTHFGGPADALRNFSLEFAFGDMTSAEILRSAELFATEVMPAFA